MEPSKTFRTPARAAAVSLFLVAATSAQEEKPTFNADIAPLIHENCTSCHRPGTAVPFALITYADVKKHAGEIAEATESRAMPLWKPERGYGAFTGERRLAPDEIKLIQTWIDAGLPEGDPAKAPPAPKISEGWQNGEPDLVVTLEKPFELPAEGNEVFRNFVIPVAIDDQKFLRAVEFRFEDSSPVLQAGLLVDRSEFARQLDQADPELGFGGIEGGSEPAGLHFGWNRGGVIGEWSGGFTRPLNPGNGLVLQLHLQPDGQARKMKPRIGLYFADKKPEKVATTIRLGSPSVDIPAGKEDYLMSAEFTTPVAIELASAFPVAHALCREIEIYALLPNGSHKPLLRIPDWDPDWLEEYRFEEPVSLPAGTKIRTEFRYDNSAENARNPNTPPQRIIWGALRGNERADVWLTASPASQDGNMALSLAAFQTDLKRQVDGYRLRLELDPGNFEANTRIGHLLVSQGRGKQAIPFLEKALKAGPESGRVYHNLGIARAGLGETEAALEAFRKSLEFEPDYLPAINGLAATLAANGKFEEAILQFRRVLEIQPDAGEARLNLGIILANLKRVEEAEKEFRTAIERAPGYARAHGRLAALLGQLGRTNEAKASFGAAVGLSPDDIEIRIDFARLLFADKAFAQAKTHLEKVLQIEPANTDAQEGLKMIQTASGASTPDAGKAKP